jgi:hypothetical protein
VNRWKDVSEGVFEDMLRVVRLGEAVLEKTTMGISLKICGMLLRSGQYMGRLFSISIY